MVTLASFSLGLVGENWGRAFSKLLFLNPASNTNLNITAPNFIAIYITPGLKHDNNYY
jgi:hypothetical protein